IVLSYGVDALSRAEAVNFDAGSGLFRGLGCEFAVCRDDYPSWTRVAQAYMSRRLDRNVMYVHAYRGLSQLCALERKALKNHCDSMARCVTMAVNNHMWMPKRGYHGSMLYGNIFMARASSLDYAGECAAILYDVVNDEVGAWIMEHMPVTEQQLPRQYPMTGRTIDEGWESARRHLLYCMAASQPRNQAALVHGLTCAISMCSEPGAGYAEAAMMQGILRCTHYKEILAGNIHNSVVNYQPDRMMAAWPRTRWTSDGKQMVAGYRPGEQFVVMLDGEPEEVMESAEYSIGLRDSFTTVALVPVDKEGWEGFSSVIRRYIPVGCERVIEAETVADPGTHLIKERVMAGRYAELGSNVNMDIRFCIDVDTPGVYAMELVYADGTSNRYNQMRSLYIDGVRCGEFVMPRIGAGPSTKAVSTPVMAVLGKGKNLVRISVSEFLEPGVGCILLDKIRLIKIN
ncbi:MAG: hypothetical protein K2M76_08115, partial [Muribaculaceae bacterium]|nr:hypothetical protein [Muribaculaceae bacterium]